MRLPRFLCCASALLALQVAAAEPAPTARPPVEPLERCYRALAENRAADLGYCDVAIDTLQGAADPAVRPRLAGAYANRATAALASGDLEAAEADLANAFAQFAPGEEAAALYLNRGNLRLVQGRFEEALGDYAQALRLSRGGLRAAHRNSALAHRALGQIDTAVQDVLAARVLAPRR